jgi:hypothetical protein
VAALTVVSPDGVALRTIELAGEGLQVGRAPHNDVVLEPDPGQFVSREHCVIERVGRYWRVRDLDSRNHVYVERAGHRSRVDASELVHGDIVCIEADGDAAAAPEGAGRHWRLAFSDPGQTVSTTAVRWLQYYRESESVWLMGGYQLPRRVEPKPKARRMLLFLLERHRQLDEPADGVVVGLSMLKRVLWSEDVNPESRKDGDVANVAWELREALEDKEQQLLRTVRDEGYRLVPRP